MRDVIIAGNWKMYKDLTETTDLIKGLLDRVPPGGFKAKVVVCPPFTSLSHAAALLQGSPIRLGAQNMSRYDEGAYTGEISWKMLKSAGCEFVVLGHSERRQYFGESDDLINEKARKALSNVLRPIICVGETLEQRKQGITSTVVGSQVRGVLKSLTKEEMTQVVIAYEPVWAIGTGMTATPQQAQEVHQMIRHLVGELYSPAVADGLVLQYGGSVKPDNAADLLSQNDIDGALVGGACLKAESFISIINSAN